VFSARRDRQWTMTSSVSRAVGCAGQGYSTQFKFIRNKVARRLKNTQ